MNARVVVWWLFPDWIRRVTSGGRQPLDLIRPFSLSFYKLLRQAKYKQRPEFQRNFFTFLNHSISAIHHAYIFILPGAKQSLPAMKFKRTRIWVFLASRGGEGREGLSGNCFSGRLEFHAGALLAGSDLISLLRPGSQRGTAATPGGSLHLFCSSTTLL